MGTNRHSVIYPLTIIAGLVATASLGSQAPCRIASSDDGGIILEVNPGTVRRKIVDTDSGLFSRVWIDGEFLTRRIGHPALPTVRRLFAMPANATPTVTVLDVELEETSLAQLGLTDPIEPAQPSYSRGADPADIYFRYDAAAYSNNAFNADELVTATRSGTMRGVGVGALIVRPLRYNPVTGQVRIYRNIRIKITFDTGGVAAAADASAEYSPFFEAAFDSMLNAPQMSQPGDVGPLSDLTRAPVTYLIMAHEDLNGSAKLAELEAWKRQKGFNVITHYVAGTDSVQTNDAWVEQQYATLSPKPSFLLIVGDESGPYAVTSEVNPVSGISRSDLIYGVMGEHGEANHIPSIYVGRFCVRTLADLDAQVDKTIWYEKGQFLVATPDLAYLTAPLGVAGYDADNYGQTHGNPQISYGWTHYFTAANGMSNAVHYLDPTAASKDTEIVSHVDTGVNLFNYTAHGAKDRFDDPRFGISHVNGLGNSGKYPLVIGSCCLTASFGDDECFGEAWLNAPDRGAIGFIGATMLTTWDEDLVMGVGTISAKNNTPPPHSPTMPGMYDAAMYGVYPTQAGMKHCGLLAVENYGGQRVKYWRALHLLGDPSLMPYFGVPSTQTVSHVAAIAAGDTIFNITTTPGAYVAITGDDGTVYGAGLADELGVAGIPLSPIADDHVHLTVTARNRQPYLDNIPVDSNTTPVHYVDAANATPQSPYTNWLTAATTIQDAVDVAAGGDTVWVSNGVYSSGTRLAGGQATPNRLVVLADIHIQSVNGPGDTHIVGSMGTNAAFAGGIRCAYLAGGMLDGFTLTNGCAPTTTTEAEASGGGVYMVNGAISNCVVIGCRAIGAGGGARGGTLYNSRAEGNHALMGGGADSSALHNCLVVDNRATSRGGGASRATLSGCTIVDNVSENEAGGISGLVAMNNSILYYNTATNDYDNYDSQGGPGPVQHSCVTPDPGGANVITTPPQFVDRGNGNYRLDVGSPCINAGHNQLAQGNSDLGGNARIQHGTVDMGAYEDSVAPVETPSIGLTSDEFEFTQPAGRSPADATLGIHNQGEGTLAYILTTNAAWLSVAPESGSSTGEVDDVTLSFDTDALAIGSYTGTVTVACTNANNSPRAVEVVVTLLESGGTEPEPPAGPGVPSTHYVDISNTGNAVSPYTNWLTAAVSIQDAVDVAAPSSTIWVADGDYDTGTRITPGVDMELDCRVVVTNPVTIRSLNGPLYTIIRGAESTDLNGGIGDGAVRCIYMTNSATLHGFMLTEGHTRDQVSLLNMPVPDIDGGAAYAPGCVLSNCIVIGNASDYQLNRCGGAIAQGHAANCLIISNDPHGMHWGTANNCTISDSAVYGTYNTTVTNSIVALNYWNMGARLGYYPDHHQNFSTGDPLFVDADAGNYRLRPDSPCVDAGDTTVAAGDVDLDNEPRVYDSVVDQGAYEQGYVDWWISISTTTLAPSALEGSSPGNQTFTVRNNGATPMDHHVSSDVGWMSASPSSGESSGETDTVTVSYDADTLPVGVYTGVLTVASSAAPNGPLTVTVQLTIHQRIFYADVDCTTPVAPYADWSTAANTIQEAVDLAAAGATVLVADGVYNVGARPYQAGYGDSRVVIEESITVESVNGAAYTTIEGAEATGGGCGTDAIRCVFMKRGTLRGFTLTNGHTIASGTMPQYANSGGGVSYIYSADTRLVTECIVEGNRAYGGGGGIHGCTAVSCIIRNNHAGMQGGGVYGAIARNCLITGNTTDGDGGGAYEGQSYACTIVGNSATNGGGGMYGAIFDNCIVYYNHAATEAENNWKAYNQFPMRYCCTTPSPSPGTGIITNAPLFVDREHGDYHLSYLSPCRDSGINSEVVYAVDLDGNTRIQNVTVDMGCYEFDPADAPSIPEGWWAKFSLASNSVMGDLDGDGWSNYAEYIADTHPNDTNAFPPVAKMAMEQQTRLEGTITVLSLVIDPSSTGRIYDVMWRTNLVGPATWTPYGINEPGNGGPLDLVVPAGESACFYRINIALP